MASKFKFNLGFIKKREAIDIAKKYGAPKINNTATTAPTVNDDITQGYGLPSFWYNASSLRAYMLIDNTEGAAVWTDLTSVAIVGGFKGFWDPSTNTPTLSDGSGTNGDYYFNTTTASIDLGSGLKLFESGGKVIDNSGIWDSVPSDNIISSVFGRVGAITAANGDYTASQVTNVAAGNIAAITVQAAIDELDGQDTTIAGDLSTHISDVANPHSVTATQVGLGNVDNTSDADKPVSTATQTALDLKQDILAEGAFVDGGKTKLDGIEALADVTDNTNVLAAIGYTPEDAANKDVTGGYAGLTLFKINFKNALDTFTSFFTNANTAERTYTFQDRDGTIADDTDLAGKKDDFTSVREVPTGTKNDVNKDFTISNTPNGDTLSVYLNGLLQIENSDFTFSGVTIAFIVAPSSDDEIITTYNY